MSENTFKVGDVVTLRSGGPYMTVGVINGCEIGCVWFDRHEARQTAFFTSECLQLALK